MAASAQGSIANTGNSKPDKVTICHRTDSNANPYVQITVDASAVDGNTTNDNGQGDHFAEHQGPIWNPTLKAQGIMWGDIIPPPPLGVVPGGLNWTAEGQAIWNNGCKIPAPPEKTKTATATTVINVATGLPVSSALPAGSKVFDVATVTPSGATGTVTYTFFTNGECSGGTSAGSGAVGTHSTIEGPLGAGSYSFMASYSGSEGFKESSSQCEPFTVEEAPEKVDTETATTVFNASNNEEVSGALTAPASVYDKATVSPKAGTGTPTGTVSYRFFTNGDCSGDGTSAGSGAQSNTVSGLAAGHYAFQASFAGDPNFNPSTSKCEPFTVEAAPPPEGKVDTTTATTVFNASNNVQVSGSLTAPASVYDKATVSPKSGTGSPTGTVSYTFFTNGDCKGDGASAGSGAQSNTESGLAAGTYAFQASFAGDSKFNPSTSKCEPFTVEAAPPGKVATQLATTVFNAGTNAALTGSETAGVSVYDTASLTHSGSGTPTGSVTYTFWTNGNCSGTGSTAGAKSVTGTGGVPNSDTIGPLSATSYSFKASYAGDNNFLASTSACEPFTLTASTGGASVSTPTPTPTGEILAETGANPPGLGFGVGLMLLGFAAMFAGALFWRRQRA